MSILAPTSEEDIARAVAKVNEVDLSKIHLNLMDMVEGPGLSAEKCAELEDEYRQLLVGRILYPDVTFSPSRDMDPFWHYHILDTRKYMQDCDQLFGYYLHHEAYLGMEGPESEAELLKAWAATQELRTMLGAPAELVFAGASAYCGYGTSPDRPQTTNSSAYCGAGTRPEEDPMP